MMFVDSMRNKNWMRTLYFATDLWIGMCFQICISDFLEPFEKHEVLPPFSNTRRPSKFQDVEVVIFLKMV